MKMNKIIFPLVIALAATLASTGCRKGTPKVTVIPGHNLPIVGGDTGTPTLPPGDKIPGGDVPGIIPGTGPGTKIGGGDTSPIDRSKYNEDRAALAAYTVHFKFDSAVVQDREQANIANVAQALSDQTLKLLIEGHCDERGTEEYNRSLGERRALALREALAKSGLDPQRVVTESFGKDKPADVGHDEAAWAKNRRGEFILLRPK